MYTGWHHGQIKRWSQIKGNDKVFVIDIDNTLTISKLGDPINHSNPKPRKSMIDYVSNLIEEKNTIVYLSARDFRSYRRTKDWLERMGVFSEDQELFLVKSSMSKIEYLKVLCAHNHHVTFIDDLSYNHEHGTVKYYNDTRLALKSISLNYLGIEFINQYK